MSLASLGLIMASHLGWRLAYATIGIIGLSVVLLSSFIIRNDKVQEPLLEKPKPPSVLDNFKFLLKNKTSMLVVIAAMFRYSAGFVRAFFTPIYLTAQFSEYSHEFSVVNFALNLVTPVSIYLGGKLAEYKESKNQFVWTPLICSLTNLVCVPFAVYMHFTESFALAMVCNSSFYIVGEMYVSLNLSILLNVTPNHMHAFQTGVFMCLTVASGSIACLLVGKLYYSLSGLALGLVLALGGGHFFSGVFFLLSGLFYYKDKQTKEFCD
mmetsp:Transcript_10145/g.15171  ORF Transcript_10145/g.15171 Transcript_10145/m.15171 type:complete len:267 (-) Transcript_10145:32-832(-)